MEFYSLCWDAARCIVRIMQSHVLLREKIVIYLYLIVIELLESGWECSSVDVPCTFFLPFLATVMQHCSNSTCWLIHARNTGIQFDALVLVQNGAYERYCVMKIWVFSSYYFTYRLLLSLITVRFYIFFNIFSKFLEIFSEKPLSSFSLNLPKISL